MLHRQKSQLFTPIISFSQGVSGFSEPDALITIKLPSGELLKGKADNNGFLHGTLERWLLNYKVGKL
ncbi:Uncharacterised protein [Staphylococcus gallinarum]|uniref:Uncharacterized protein n=1 Tax=Staphylococcus gallinarum TaxID=1293 RepID=A0A380FME5_STAGA|nr:Uncharacterised protein [Staphylococcus gallinarum]